WAKLQKHEQQPGADEKKPDATPVPAPIRWHADYDAARKEAKERKLPLFIFFKTNPSFWTQRFEKGTLESSDVAELLNEHYVPLRLDPTGDNEAHQRVGEMFKIDRFPTTVITDHEGQVLRRIVGRYDAEGLMRQLPSGPTVKWRTD